MKQSIKEIEQLLFEQQEAMDEETWQKLQGDDRKGVRRLLERYEKLRLQRRELEQKYETMSSYEKALWEKGYTYIAGIDEVGRGPLAGPVVTAAVILAPERRIIGLDDSKKLTEKKREALFEEIYEKAEAVCIGIASPREIDDLNIYQAAKAAMVKAVEGLPVRPDYLLVDAMTLPLDIGQESIIKGDSASISIAAASIIAKVTRDRMMVELGEKHPLYGFEKHMGYPTKEHIEAIDKHGVIDEHRRSFAPVSERIR